MKVKPQKTVTLSEITAALNAFPLQKARERVYSSKNAVICLEVIVLKVVKRNGATLRLFGESMGEKRRMNVFAGLSETGVEQVETAKIRKGSTVSLTGKFQTFGTSAINLSDCRLKVDKLAP